eukprot:246594_1
MRFCLTQFVILCMIYCSNIVYGETVTITTSLGEIKGIEDAKTVAPITLYIFLGIAYANPPVDNLRFRQTVLNTTKWNSVYDATNFGSECVQGNSSDNEDCLFLNIWTTKSNVDNAKNNQLVPVMFWIHGGGFTAGSGNSYDGSALVGEYGNVVYVSINYRLGSLGFLNNEAIYNEDANFKSYGGSNGLYDQITALKWVKQNIASYGGDPNQIQIFGESAGSLSVCMLLTSPLATGLFQRAIGESGSCIGGWGPHNLTDGITYGNNELKQAGYPINNLTYLRSIPAQTFISKVGVDSSVDGLILTQHPYDFYTNGNVKTNANDAIIFGFNSIDGIVAFPYFAGPAPLNDNQYKSFIARYISNTSQQTMIHDTYYPSNNFPAYGNFNSYELAWWTINCDLCVACPTLKLINDIVSNEMTSRVYGYEFFGPGNNSLYYAPHASEIEFVFDGEDASFWDLPWDQQLADSMLSAWVNFGKYGKPNITNIFDNVNIEWNEYNMKDQSIMQFKGKDI